MYYAMLDENNICVSVQESPTVIDSDDLMELDSYDTSVLGKMWTGSEWVDNPNPPVIEPEPVTNEEIKAKMDQLEQQNVAIMMGMVDVFAAVTSANGGAE